jgi:hypothetical protein
MPHDVSFAGGELRGGRATYTECGRRFAMTKAHTSLDPTLLCDLIKPCPTPCFEPSPC